MFARKLVAMLSMAFSMPAYGAAADRAGGLMETVFYAFSGGNDGAQPNGDLLRDTSGNIFGTAAFGGSSNYGTVFKLTPSGTLSVLHSFAGGVDGANPLGGVVLDPQGNLYGTTTYGGASDKGEIFEITAAGAFSVLYSFTGAADGTGPLEQMVRDTGGNLYGIAGGGAGAGLVFRLSPGGKLTALHIFTGSATDGNLPLSSLLLVGNKLYGNTYYGGMNGAGTVFELSLSGKFTLLHSFAAGSDGGFPNHSRLARDSKGNLFGGTKDGGSSNSGVLFKLAPDGTETILHAFSGGANDGAYPFGGVLVDKTDTVYGTTAEGGSAGDGTAFKLAADGTLLILSLTGTNGNFPQGGLAKFGGARYGSTQYGGTARFGGVIFKLSH